jgi:hypothetical protein
MKKIETEADWLACTDPMPMLEFLQWKASDRKLRLLAVACHRRIWPFLDDKVDCRKTLEFAERFADGLATRNELHGRAWGKPGSAFSVVLYKAWDAAENSIDFGAGTIKEAVLRRHPENYRRRQEAFDAVWKNYSLGEARRIADTAMPAEWVAEGLSAWTEERLGQCRLIRDIFGNPFRPVTLDANWLTPTVSRLTATAYEERALPSGELDTARLALLADALEEAGCDNADILNHCRSGGPHARGCWVVDTLLDKK